MQDSITVSTDDRTKSAINNDEDDYTKIQKNTFDTSNNYKFHKGDTNLADAALKQARIQDKEVDGVL